MDDPNHKNHDLLLLAALLLNRREPMAPHHVAAVRERLGYATDAQLLEAVQKGVPPNASLSVGVEYGNNENQRTN